VLGYETFASHFTPERPVYGLQAQGVLEGQAPCERLETIAANYIEALKTRQPHGPYHIGGWSMGGQIAYEIAVQLRNQGDEVAYLLVVDTWLSNGPHITSRARLRRQASKLHGALRNRLRCWRKGLAADQYSSAPVKRRRFANATHRAMVTAHRRALADYSPTPFDGQLTLFVSSSTGKEAAKFLGENLGWDRLAKQGVRRYSLPGEHSTMLFGANAIAFASLVEDTIPD
jgi:thioesterase domain-containing protein